MANNNVNSQADFNYITVVTNDTQIKVTQPVTNVIEVVAIGPQGPAGPNQDISSLATTGSNIFIGNQTITGSLTISGSFVLPVTSSNTPNWTGIQGEMIFGDDGSGNYVIWAYLGGTWKSGSLF